MYTARAVTRDTKLLTPTVLALLVAVSLSLRAGDVRAQAAAPAAPADASPSDAEYWRVVDEALQEFSLRHYEEARALFLRAHQLKPSARTLRGLGITSFELRQYGLAIEELEQALAETTNPLTPEQRAEVKSLLERARRFVGTVEVELVPGDATLLVDGAATSDRKLVLEVGEHTLTARAPGHREMKSIVRVESGASTRTKLELSKLGDPIAGPAGATRATPPKDDPSLFESPWVWVGAGAVIVGAAVASAIVLQPEDETLPLEGGDIEAAFAPVRSAQGASITRGVP